MKNQTLGKRLKYYRTLKGYTQDELASLSSVAIRTIQRIEKEEVQPHLQTLKLLAESLEIGIDDLKIIENPNHETVQKKWLLLLHSSPFLGLIIPFANILFPLFLWIHKEKDNPLYNQHGRAIINFQCSITLYLIISLVLFFPFPGYNFFLTGLVFLFGIITTLYNIKKAIDSETYRYPLSIQFLKN
ncbi:Transcriptional regulator [Tenacibaculum sp. 190130A14a]|uniref:Helix-turn-helix domain-containing protein n=1 Tax=Tenacibaculum polynesiense TaxID=3137857 RepID=A0ABM9PD87_9FLAO